MDPVMKQTPRQAPDFKHVVLPVLSLVSFALLFVGYLQLLTRITNWGARRITDTVYQSPADAGAETFHAGAAGAIFTVGLLLFGFAPLAVLYMIRKPRMFNRTDM
jgi:hypothetical protein